jgi:hypothetical protein
VIPRAQRYLNFTDQTGFEFRTHKLSPSKFTGTYVVYGDCSVYYRKDGDKTLRCAIAPVLMMTKRELEILCANPPDWFRPEGSGDAKATT